MKYNIKPMKHHLFLSLSFFMTLLLPLHSANTVPVSGTCGRKIAYNVDSTNLQWNYNTSSHTLTITGSGIMKDYDNDTKAPWYPWSNEIQSILLPDGITSIGSYAFISCSEITQIDLPESLKTVGMYSFYYCNKLSTISFGNQIEKIGGSAFSYCSKIRTLDFGDSPVRIESNAFYQASGLVSVTGRKMLSIDIYGFRNCVKLADLNLGDSLQIIGYESFGSCHSLRSLHIPAKVYSIYYNSFIECDSLDVISVDPANTTYDSRNGCNAIILTASNALVLGCVNTQIPSEVVSIESNAFYACRRLTSISLPEGLQRIGSNAFANCTGLTSFHLPESVSSVDCGILEGCTKINSPVYNSVCFAYMPPSYAGEYTIPSTIQSVACRAFSECSHVTSVTFPGGVTYLGESAFTRCGSLSEVILSPRIKEIGSYTFYYCSQLASIDIPDSVESIGYTAFGGCASLQSISIPADLRNFGGDVFSGCTSLRDITWNVRNYPGTISSTSSWSDPLYSIRPQVVDFTFGDSVRIIPANLCYGMNRLTSLSFGCNISKIGENAFEGCENIKSIYWNMRVCEDPRIYAQAPFYPIRDSITDFTFGDSVRYIPNYLCHSMSRLRRLHIPEHVASIGAFAFRYINALDSISVDARNTHYDSRNGCNAIIDSESDVLLLGCYKTQIPDDIKGIGECAFRNVRNLTSVILQDNVTFVGSEAFNGCKDMKHLSMADGLRTIGDYAFQDCSQLPSLTLPEKLESIGLRAFANCSGLEAVNCNASNPPAIDVTSFSGTTCPFYVPCGNIAHYRAAPVWSTFGNRLAGEALYTLEVRPNEFAYGEVNVLQKPDCEHTAVLEAVPSRGYRFIAWTEENTGNELSTEAHYEFALEADLSIIAVFGRINQGLDALPEDEEVIWYDIMGHRVEAPTHGVYIEVRGGATRKVIMP